MGLAVIHTGVALGRDGEFTYGNGQRGDVAFRTVIIVCSSVGCFEIIHTHVGGRVKHPCPRRIRIIADGQVAGLESITLGQLHSDVFNINRDRAAGIGNRRGLRCYFGRGLGNGDVHPGAGGRGARCANRYLVGAAVGHIFHRDRLAGLAR